ncbi:MAG TPA: ABC transporter ATP-binding protein [Vampirovibrionales bacterium]
MSTNSVIVADKLTKTFGNKTVVNNVSFEVAKGEIFGFLGPNGAGKSTVIRMLCGVLKPTSGEGSIEGQNIKENSRAIRQSVGYVSQKFGLYQDLTAAQNLEFYGRIYGMKETKIQERIKEVCSQTNLIPYLNNKAATLSGGWKQRLALACAILHKPKVVFLDEPTAGIDPVARREVWDLLFELSCQGITLFVTTHYMDEAERCNRVAYIYNSNLIAIGSSDELVNLPNLFPQGYRQLSIEAAIIMPVYEYLQNWDAALNVTLFGRTLHCLLPEEFSTSFLQNKLTNELNLKDLEIHESKPSLEDVFVILTKKYSS